MYSKPWNMYTKPWNMYTKAWNIKCLPRKRHF